MQDWAIHLLLQMKKFKVTQLGPKFACSELPYARKKKKEGGKKGKREEGKKKKAVRMTGAGLVVFRFKSPPQAENYFALKKKPDLPTPSLLRFPVH